MGPVHVQALEAACSLADDTWTFRVADLARMLPHLNPATLRTHVASRCCVNAPSNHQSRYRYFRALGGGVYRIERAFRQRPRHARGASQNLILASFDSGVDSTLIAETLAMPPTERLETMRRAARSLETIRSR
jgi:hypothetical protein